MWQTPRSDLRCWVELFSEYVAQKVVIVHHEWVEYSKKYLHSSEAEKTSKTHKEHQWEDPYWYAIDKTVCFIAKG
jgi:hypothetical protein